MKTRLISCFVACLMVAGLVGLAPDTLARLGDNVFDQIDLLVDVRHEIVKNYVEKPDEQKMVERAVRAMVSSLNDRYTVFLTTDELEPFDKQIRGIFSGIGAEIDIFNNHLRIVSPLEDSPAWNSGVMAGDTVLEIDGKSTQEITISQAVSRLTGPEGTQVAVKVRHLSGEEQDIVITRARINVQTVRGFRRTKDNHWDYLLDSANGVGYVRITQFTQSTARGVKEALDQLLSQGARGLILDLRFNPGGLLDSAVAISDYFLEKGQRIVSVKGRSVPERVEESTDDTTIDAIPVVVLANGASASASEIVTGALSDNKRAKFIGTRTFGKGSVQQVRMLESGQGALKMTHAYYYLPNGRNIHRRKDKELWGVDPEDGFYVPMSPDQVRKMIETRRENPLLRAAEENQEHPIVTPEWLETHLADPQLAAGLQAMIGKLETGEWPVVGESNAVALARENQRSGLIMQRDLLHERLELIKKELAKLDTPDEEPPSEDPIDTDEDEARTDDTPIKAAPEEDAPAQTQPVAPQP